MEQEELNQRIEEIERHVAPFLAELRRLKKRKRSIKHRIVVSA